MQAQQSSQSSHGQNISPSVSNNVMTLTSDTPFSVELNGVANPSGGVSRPALQVILIVSSGAIEARINPGNRIVTIHAYSQEPMQPMNMDGMTMSPLGSGGPMSMSMPGMRPMSMPGMSMNATPAQQQPVASTPKAYNSSTCSSQDLNGDPVVQVVYAK
jgi:hypothetical protein